MYKRIVHWLNKRRLYCPLRLGRASFPVWDWSYGLRLWRAHIKRQREFWEGGYCHNINDHHDLKKLLILDNLLERVIEPPQYRERNPYYRRYKKIRNNKGPYGLGEYTDEESELISKFCKYENKIVEEDWNNFVDYFRKHYRRFWD